MECSCRNSILKIILVFKTIFQKLSICSPKQNQEYSKQVYKDRRLNASMTLEAAMVLPLFMFAILSLGFVMEAVRLQIHIGCAAGQTAKELASYGYTYLAIENGIKNIGKDKNNSEDKAVKNTNDVSNKGKKNGFNLISVPGSFYAKSRICKLAGKEYLDNSIISGGSSGIHTIGSQVLKDDKWIQLIVVYEIKLPFSIIPNAKIKVAQYAKSHAWVGYCRNDASNDDKNEKIVYMTEFGGKYHLSKGCKYLNMAVLSVDKDNIANIRNKNGAKYYCCHRCRGKQCSAYYITEYGNRYHASRDCTAISRTIIEKKLSEVEGIPCCKECERNYGGS